MSLKCMGLEVLIISLISLIPLSQTVCVTEAVDTSVNYVTNGDFQTPYLGPNKWRFTTDQLYGWTSKKIEQGTGKIYNAAWGNATQVIEMDTDHNEMYNQTLILTKSKFSMKISYAARTGRSLNSCGLRIWWNGQVIRDIPVSLDYNIHTQTFILQAHDGENHLILEGQGTSDGGGMTCDNVIFNQIQNYNRVEVNGTCLCNVGYFDDHHNWNCQPCSMMDSQCQVCSYDAIGTVNATNTTNATTIYKFSCSVCSEGFFSQGGACVHCQSRHPGCFNCSQDGSDCYNCNQTINYFKQIVTSVSIHNTSYESCILCTLDHCITCADLSTCTKCLNTDNYFLNDTDMLCQVCNLEGCIICNNLTSCSVCDNSSYYFHTLNDTLCTFCNASLNMFVEQTNLTCVKCSLVGCQICNNLETCRKCASGFYLVYTTELCEPCSSMDSQCEVCSYDNLGTMNATNTANESTIYKFTCLICSQGYYSQDGACTHCQNFHPGCFNCSQDGIDCYNCNQTINYFKQIFTNLSDESNSYGTCTLCSLQHCITCSSLQTCVECLNTENYFLNQTSMVCEVCNLQGCITCTNLTECIECDNSTYYFASQNDTFCTFCNAALNMFVEPTNLTCEKCSLVGCQVCHNLQTCRKCTPGLYLLNSSGLCEPCVLEGCLSCLTQTTCGTCDMNNEYYIDKSGSGVCTKCLSCNCRQGGRIQQKGVPEIVYSEQECQGKQDIEHLATFIGVSSYILLFFSLISVKIVGLELFGVLQLAFFNLADNKFVNIYLSPLLGWKYLNGFNIDLISQTVVPENVQAIKYNNSFLANINVMFLILLAEFLAALLITLLSKKFPVFKKLNKFFLHQVFITLFLFNSFNIAFSAGLHFKYASPSNTEYYSLSTFAGILGIGLYLAILILLQTSKEDEFGEFKNKFKKDCVNQIYMSVSVVYRIALGFYMAISNQQILGTLFILAISFVYIMYNIINLPFSDFYQNYRANLCHITQLVILLVTNYYQSMRYNDQLEVKGRIHTPAKLEIAMIVICLFVSGACLVYEIYLMIKQKIWMKKTVSTSQSRSFNTLTLQSEQMEA